jgi:hypothetical protein
MNAKQRDNTAKYLYDLSKIVFTFSVVANAVAKEFNLTSFWLGMLATVLLFFFAYVLDRGGEKGDKQ